MGSKPIKSFFQKAVFSAMIILQVVLLNKTLVAYHYFLLLISLIKVFSLTNHAYASEKWGGSPFLYLYYMSILVLHKSTVQSHYQHLLLSVIKGYRQYMYIAVNHK